MKNGTAWGISFRGSGSEFSGRISSSYLRRSLVLGPSPGGTKMAAGPPPRPPSPQPSTPERSRASPKPAGSPGAARAGAAPPRSLGAARRRGGGETGCEWSGHFLFLRSFPSALGGGRFWAPASRRRRARRRGQRPRHPAPCRPQPRARPSAAPRVRRFSRQRPAAAAAQRAAQMQAIKCVVVGDG